MSTRPLERSRTGASHHHRRALLTGAAALCLVLPSGATAQQAADDDDQALGTIVLDSGDDDRRSIVATQIVGVGALPTDALRMPAAVSVITARDMQQRAVQDTEQALQYTAGVTTDFYGGDDRFDYFKIRGLDAYSYRDGLMIGANFGGVREEPFAYERIEVLKGASSAGFGISDPGGAVNFVTKRPTGERFGEGYARIGSFQRKEVGLDMGDVVPGRPTLSWRLTGLVRDGEAEYDDSRDDEKFVMGGLSWRPTDATSLTLVLDRLDRDGVPGGGGHPLGVGLDRSTFLGEPDFNYRGTDRDSASLFLDHDFGSGLSLHAKLRYSDTETDFGYAYVAGTEPGTTRALRYFFVNDSAAEEWVADAHLRYDRSFGGVESRSVLGVAWRDSSEDSTTWWTPAPSIDWTRPVHTGGIDVSRIAPYTDTSRDTDSKAVYLQQELTFADRLVADLGLRHDWIDVSELDRVSGRVSRGEDSETSVRLGLTYLIGDTMSVYGAYSESVVPASAATLEPETGEQYEIGFKYRPEGMRALFTAALFDLTKKNITRTDPVTRQIAPIGEVRVRGREMEARAELTETLSLTAAWTWLDSEIIENGTLGNEGNELAFAPDQSASLWISKSVARREDGRETTLALGARYSDGYWFEDANLNRADSAIVVDAAVTHQFTPETTLALNVSNLFDEKHVAYGGYYADFYNPGRSVSLTLRRSW